MIDLTGKHVFIVGGSRGIGAAAARMAVRAGARVSINYLANTEVAQRVVSQIEDTGGQALAYQADAAAEGALDAAMRNAVARLGPLHGVVISAAGIFEGLPIEEMTGAFWDRMMNVNLRSTFLAVRAAVPHLRSGSAGGSIVIYLDRRTARLRGLFRLRHVEGRSDHVHALDGLELAPDRIRVNCVAPAWTETDMVTEKIDAIGRELVVSGFPLGRIGLPDDIAGATVYLLSDLASFVTGATLTVDGGMDMRGRGDPSPHPEGTRPATPASGYPEGDNPSPHPEGTRPASGEGVGFPPLAGGLRGVAHLTTKPARLGRLLILFGAAVAEERSVRRRRRWRRPCSTLHQARLAPRCLIFLWMMPRSAVLSIALHASRTASTVGAASVGRGNRPARAPS